MEVTEAKEMALRLLIRSEVLAMVEDDTLGAFIRACIVAGFREAGMDIKLGLDEIN
jgi:hypothetical protein